jgi:hypothetical protein
LIVSSLLQGVIRLPLGKYIDLFDLLIRAIGEAVGIEPPRFKGSRIAEIDDRIAKLEVAKSALNESLELR